jgi:hypothetical protein
MIRAIMSVREILFIREIIFVRETTSVREIMLQFGKTYLIPEIEWVSESVLSFLETYITHHMIIVISVVPLVPPL